jgi:hypothetical protein
MQLFNQRSVAIETGSAATHGRGAVAVHIDKRRRVAKVDENSGTGA